MATSRDLIAHHLARLDMLTKVEIVRALQAPQLNLIRVLQARSEQLQPLEELQAKLAPRIAKNSSYGLF